MMFGRGEVMKEYMVSNANMNATIVEYVNGMEVIKAFNQTASSMGRFQSAVLKVRDITTKWYKHCWPFMSISQAILPSRLPLFCLSEWLLFQAARLVLPN